MKTMKAWVVTAPRKLELLEVPVPTPRSNEILIKTTYTCLCNGSDPGIYQGHEAYTPPFVFGHEAGGIVVEQGEDVTACKPGDLVFCWCAIGSFAEYQLICPDEVALFRVPKALSPEAAPVMELVIAACRALMGRPAGEGRSTLLICGLGPSGLVLTQYARLLGYRRIVGWDLYGQRRSLALELGADAVYDAAVVGPEQLAEMGEFDVSVDSMGNDILPGEPTFTSLLRATRRGGTVVSYGHPHNGRHFSPYVFQSRNLTMVPPEGDLDVIREKGRFVLEAVEAGTIRVEPLITHRMGFGEIGPAFQHLLEHPEDQIKVVFNMDKVQKEGAVL